MFFNRKDRRNNIKNQHENNEQLKLEDESYELKFQRKFLRCKKKKIKLKKIIIFIIDLEKISVNFAKIVENTIVKYNPAYFRPWMLSKIKFKVNFSRISQ